MQLYLSSHAWGCTAPEEEIARVVNAVKAKTTHTIMQEIVIAALIISPSMSE